MRRINTYVMFYSELSWTGILSLLFARLMFAVTNCYCSISQGALVGWLFPVILRFIRSKEACCIGQVGLSYYVEPVMVPGRCCVARVVLVIGDVMRGFLFSIAVLCGLPAVCAADVPVLVPDGTGKSVCHSQSIGLSQGDAPARFCIRNSKFLFAHQEYSVDIREASVLG
ncbi:MAG: hypothetical protein ACRDD3_09165, partial [Azovibrio sp.]